MSHIIISIITLVILVSPVLAGSPGTTSAQFLKYCMGARPAGMGETFAGIADDVNTLYFNPAGLARLKGFEISTAYAVWFQDMYYGNLKTAFSNSLGNFGINVIYSDYGKIPEYDDHANETGDYTANDTAIGISYARKLNDTVCFGGTLKSINQVISQDKADAFGVDLGVLYQMNEKLSCAFVVQNLGTKVKFVTDAFDLPMNIKLGAGYRVSNSLMTGLEINIPNDNQPNLHIGGEYILFKNIFVIRAGFKTTTINDLEPLAGLSLGLGLRLSNFKFAKSLGLEYAFVPYGELGITHRIDFIVKLK